MQRRTTARSALKCSAPGRSRVPYDMLIGAHARSEGLIVVTSNMRDFERMPGLRVENWV